MAKDESIIEAMRRYYEGLEDEKQRDVVVIQKLMLRVKELEDKLQAVG